MNEKHEPINEKQSLNELTNETPDCQELDDDALEGTSGGTDGYSKCRYCKQMAVKNYRCTNCGRGVPGSTL